MPRSLSLSLCARKNKKKVHRRNVSCVVYKIDKSSTKKSRFQELYDQETASNQSARFTL